MSETPPKADLATRLQKDFVLVAEGYLFELERRGRLQAGTFVPEVALENPNALKELHREFLDCGTDVIEAFTYYAHREKMRLIGKEGLLEPLNRAALSIAKEVAQEAKGEPPLVAGNLSNSNIYKPGDAQSEKMVRSMFEEMLIWSAEAEVDFVIAETFYHLGEAALALEMIKKYNLPAVVTFGLYAQGILSDGFTVEQACQRLEDMGADVVGMNCFRGPATMLPHIAKIREKVSCPVAALPVPYRTTPSEPTFFHMHDHWASCRLPNNMTFPTALDPFLLNRYETADFAQKALDMGVKYIGLCCGCCPVHIRTMAEQLGRKPPASRYSPNMKKHFLFGDDPGLLFTREDLRGKA
ncbi:homocysteine S-methyltransferase family protein [Dethiosulfatarculus sandiegensis]|uniref:homocysteine S-methyltransferase family protein n=1 Tax=Dethiosulfatarculus sandiegensis TaxID=1429043 RepID=UPI0005CA1F0B|nr:homocysteine S-methyltransferase family protein [Dethiosulfatarculus sandiegensis]